MECWYTNSTQKGVHSWLIPLRAASEAILRCGSLDAAALALTSGARSSRPASVARIAKGTRGGTYS